MTVALLVAVGAAESGRSSLMFLTQKKRCASPPVGSPPASPATGVHRYATDGALRRRRRGVPRLPICFNARQLDETTLVTNAKLGGTVPLWEWIGERCHQVQLLRGSPVNPPGMRLNGRQTIYQMMQLAEEVAPRWNAAGSVAVQASLSRSADGRIEIRIEDLRTGEPPQEWTVPGSHALLDELRQRGITLYLASGTDLKFVRQEAELLDVAKYFGPHIYGAWTITRAFPSR